MKMLTRHITRTIYPVLVAGVILGLFSVVETTMASNIDDTNKYAWGTNVGWINFKPTNGGVTVYADHLEGYAWGENVGWIRMGTHTAGGTHSYGNTSNTNYGVNIDGSGNLSGYAWGSNVGWINFNPTNGGVTINLTSGSLSGYAWGENVGWIRFENTTLGANAYGVDALMVGVGNIDNTNKYAWGTNVGWINFKPTNGGVTVYADHLEGYAWGENVGWIRMGTHTAGGTHSYGNTSNTNYGVNIDGSGNLSGYAWGSNVGWINFNPTNGGVTINLTSGSLSGYAWGENVGWIRFENTTLGANSYGVDGPSITPTAIDLSFFSAQVVDSDPSSVEVAWETAAEIDNAGFNLHRATSPDGPYIQINGALITATGNPAADERYTFIDTPGTGTFFYKLEDVDIHGTSSWHGPVSVEIHTPTAVSLSDLAQKETPKLYGLFIALALLLLIALRKVQPNP